MIREFIQRQKDWSIVTFGEGKQTEKICKHISKELDEIRNAPDDLIEWVDVIILAFDGAWRAGYTPVQIINAMIQKQAKNFERKWIAGKDDEPFEHDRTLDKTL